MIFASLRAPVRASPTCCSPQAFGGSRQRFVDTARENPLGTISFPNLCGWDGGRLVRRVILDLAGT